jgi:osmotically-inducible protein OsmY
MAVTYTDQEIRTDVWDEISHDIRVDSSNVAVTVMNGIVYLDGTVPSYSQKITAGQDARRIKGVFDVVNNLVVRLPRVWSDAEIRATVRGNLDRDVRITTPLTIDVMVSGGVVTLTGTVSSYDQKNAALDDAWTVPGVIDVINNIVVTPAISRSDAEIEADVRRTLECDPAINAANVHVTVSNGTAFLRGTVPTYYQIQQAATDAWSVAGVVSVVNELTVCR